MLVCKAPFSYWYQISGIVKVLFAERIFLLTIRIWSILLREIAWATARIITIKCCVKPIMPARDGYVF
jgi:hypothetical protein